jgi:hypothetical protein
MTSNGEDSDLPTSPGLLRWYPSKIDRWLAGALSAPPVAVAVICFASARAGSMPGLAVGAALGALVGGIYFGLVLPMRYGLSDSQLVVRFGIRRLRIPLATISEVTPTANPLGSPALSLDRLRVRSDHQGAVRAVMISPTDRSRFLDELALKAGLKREGDRLFRA